ncbi:hypothetical protein EJ066_07710 [Mesorhizobium sp. M9A.F.Ca.ET.002.03.1.2]|nr:hypothetical protein EJ066_07710 [Mesorhizobium sp. M9A.F.Ca.ET.002.03.1.2]
MPDIGIAAIWLLISLNYWVGYKLENKLEAPDERALGASVIMGQLSSVITGSSVILAGIGAFVALENRPIDGPEKYHILYAAVWAVVALGLAIFTMGILPPHAPKTNFVRLRSIGILCSISLFFCLAAGVRFLFAVASILFS